MKSIRYITEKISHNTWNVFAVTSNDQRGYLVAQVYDQKTLTILTHAPAELILGKLLSRADKKHYLPKNANALTRFQYAFVKIMRRL